MAIVVLMILGLIHLLNKTIELDVDQNFYYKVVSNYFIY